MEKSSNKLVDLSVAFAIEILNLVKYLKSQHETIICNQIGRAGTSIGANIHEAQYAHGKADFVSKLQIALKESNETSYWLLLLNKTNIIPNAEYERLENLCKEIRITLIASVNTAKQNIKEVKTALDKFYNIFDNPQKYDLFFYYNGLRYQLSSGGYILTERAEDCEDEMEYGFDENGKDLAEAVLNSKVNQTRDKTIREILSELPPEELRMG